MCIGSAVVNVMDSHSRDRGSSPSYTLNNFQFILDKSSAELVLYL